MYKIRFIKQIHSCFSSFSTSDIFIERLITLPFIPVIGMYIQQGNFDAEITELHWNNDKMLFIAYTEPNKELYDIKQPLFADTNRRVFEIAQEYEKDGWTIRPKDRAKYSKV